MFFGDQNDVAVFEIGISTLPSVDLDGCMTSIAGPFAGMKVAEARKSVIEHLENEGKFTTVEEQVPVSEGKNPVEIILLKEWYVRQTHIQDRIRELFSKILTSTHPETSNSSRLMENISIDWPLVKKMVPHRDTHLVCR